MHDLDLHAYELPAVEEWLAGDDRTLAFVVSDADGDPVDISDATVEWALYRRAYQDDPADAVLSGDADGVELVTDDRVDSEAGQFEVRVDGDASRTLDGEYWHRPAVTQSDDTRASWRGRVVVTASI